MAVGKKLRFDGFLTAVILLLASPRSGAGPLGRQIGQFNPRSETEASQGRRIVQLKPGFEAEAVFSGTNYELLEALIPEKSVYLVAERPPLILVGSRPPPPDPFTSPSSPIKAWRPDRILPPPDTLDHRPPPERDTISWGLGKVGATQAWMKGRGGGIRVAVLDTGVDCSHPDLVDNCVEGYNARLFDGSSTEDRRGHGTHVSGIIAAKYGNGGSTGVAPDAQIVPVKVLSDTGSGRDSDIIRGLYWCASNGIHIANLSLRIHELDIFVILAIEHLVSNGVVVIVAAGNDGDEAEGLSLLANTLSVAAIDSYDDLWSRSNHGADVDFAAPGVNIPSTIPGGGSESKTGTSMAAPFISGLAALWLSIHGLGENDSTRLARVQEGLKNASTPLPDAQGYLLPDASRF